MNNKIDLIKQKEKELSKLKLEVENEQSRCQHVWDKTIFDPEEVSEPYGFEIEAHGSDIWTVPKGYHMVQKDRWSRTCSKCLKKEYTKEKKPTVWEPKF
jgi:hypothetical protein